MVDFKKLLGRERLTKEIDPMLIFDRLDKESGKEYIRPPQEYVLRDWHKRFRSKRDVIVKLHTGQGKTLIGLLMLQSSMNEGLGPAVYLCPNTYLVNQTVEQAHSFGIKTVQFSIESNKPPLDFLNSDAVLVTTCSKMFNGKSVFGVAGSKEHIQLGAITIDDAHKCVDIIRESFSINTMRNNPDGSENPVYKELWGLFQEALSRQAPGTCLDIYHGEESLMAVPFWAWYGKQKEVLDILRRYKESEKLLFVWDLLKDKISQCLCIFSGRRLQIAPRLLPVEMIPSFTDAKRRIFLSATLTEDAFLVRDLGIEDESVSSPLSSVDVKYSGERMILIPLLVDPSLTRERIVSWITNLTAKHGNFGIASIVPSFNHAIYWEKFGGNVTKVQNLHDSITELKAKIKQNDAKNVVVLVNEYDGVDLPDNTCRILCLDSLPSYNSLIDEFLHEMRPSSTVIRRQLAQRIEQGMGRAIRGSSDWSIVVVIGNNLTDFLSEKAKRSFLSTEAQMQIQISEELADAMKAEGGGLSVIEKLVNQCLKRDPNWKEYYRDRMEKVKTREPNKKYLRRAVVERKAETLYQQGHYQRAVDILQELVGESDQVDKGWYFQLMATYLYPINPTVSMDKQLKAHSENPRLFRPEIGVSYSRLPAMGSSRESLILEWIKKYESHNSLIIYLMNILDKITFNASSDIFEEGIGELGRALGFTTQRPEKESGSGPDNLWHIRGKTYWLIGCKNMVSASRTRISKSETGQLNNDIGWFKKNYEGCNAVPILIHPAGTLESDAFVTEPSWVISEASLEKLKNNTKNFYNSLNGISVDVLSTEMIKQNLKTAHLDIDDLTEYRQRIEGH